MAKKHSKENESVFKARAVYANNCVLDMVS